MNMNFIITMQLKKDLRFTSILFDSLIVIGIHKCGLYERMLNAGTFIFETFKEN